VRLALLLVPIVIIAAAVVVALLDPHLVRPAGVQVSDPEADARQLHGAQIAYRIRAELVCCQIYGRVHDTGELTLKQALKSRDWHDLCYWGEASARIAETPRHWRDDQDECAQGCPPQCRHERAADELVRLGQDNPTDGAA
jgi:hypothetical protein